MSSAIDLKTGNIIRYKASLWRVVDTVHVKPGKGGAFMQIELKNVYNNSKLNERFRSEDKVEKLISENKKMQFLFTDDTDIFLMNLENYDQVSVKKNLLNGDNKFLINDIILSADIIDDEIVSLNLPDTMVLEVTETQPYIKGQTAKSSFKPATLNNGFVTQVPEFIKVGEEIILKTETGEYLERNKNNKKY